MDLYKVLKDQFGFEQFRPGQEAVISHVLAGNDTIAILPTGMGKSLCYQLPAYLLSGTVLIVSPLVALMEDQVAIMKKNGEKRVVALNSFLTHREKNRMIGDLAKYKFIFISPEMLGRHQVLQQLRAIDLALIVVDEAHCVSQWGFDFRPDYLRIGTFFQGLKRPVILALTATADDKVTNDIRSYLQLTSPVIHRESVDRPNISYNMLQVDNDAEKTEWIKTRLLSTTGPGIIYVSSRKRADTLAGVLQESGIAAAAYHAGKGQEDRAFIQEQFINGELSWICATNAFGMGIHKDDIRQVIHEHIPATIAGYVQEVGRAGRDGKQSVVTLLHAPEDIPKTRFIMQDDIPQEEEIRYYEKLLGENKQADEAAEWARISETGKRIIDYYRERMSLEEVIAQMRELIRDKERQLEQMVRIVHTEQCVREQLLAYFGERKTWQPEFCCSNCDHAQPLLEKSLVMPNSTKTLMSWEERLNLLLVRQIDWKEAGTGQK